MEESDVKKPPAAVNEGDAPVYFSYGNSKVYHTSKGSHSRQLAKATQDTCFDTRDEAEDAGLSACKDCFSE